MHKFLSVIFLILLSTSTWCEQVTTNKKIPMKAAALSFIIPGGGQFYNGSYVKSGIVAGLEFTFIGLAVSHQLESDKWFEKANDYENYSAEERDKFYAKYVNYYNKRQSDIWWAGIVVFLSTIDAYVDAHLFDYDKTKDKIHLKFEDNMLSLEYRF